jgi:crotonobetainyl-CoA:carnitine CoA-transferase CaiB-like acyl-CoA transferase
MGTNHPEDRFWSTFCELTGKPELIDDPRYAVTDIRVKNAAELVGVYDKIFLNRSRDEWLNLLREKGLWYAPVQTLEEVLSDPQAMENGYVSDFDHPILGSIKIPGFPIFFSRNRAGTKAPSPALGEHTDPVMQEMGYSETEIQRLRESRIIK